LFRGILDGGRETIGSGTARQALIILGALVVTGLYTKLSVLFTLAALAVVIGFSYGYTENRVDRIVPVGQSPGHQRVLLSALADRTQLPPTGELRPGSLGISLSTDIIACPNPPP